MTVRHRIARASEKPEQPAIIPTTNRKPPRVNCASAPRIGGWAPDKAALPETPKALGSPISTTGHAAGAAAQAATTSDAGRQAVQTPALNEKLHPSASSPFSNWITQQVADGLEL